VPGFRTSFFPAPCATCYAFVAPEAGWDLTHQSLLVLLIAVTAAHNRLLYGTLHVRAYDWVNPPPECGGVASSPANSDTSSNSSTCTSEPGLGGIGGNIQPARLVTDRVLTAPADTMVLFPQSGACRLLLLFLGCQEAGAACE
jgi:hypothetical protein